MEKRRRSQEQLAIEYRQKAKLMEEKAKRLEFSVRERERKAKLRAFYEIGALIELAGLSWRQVDRTAVLGVFAKLARAQANPLELEELIKAGEKILEQRAPTV